MSATSSETNRASPAAGSGRRLFVTSLFIVLSVGFCNLLARETGAESVRTEFYRWLRHPGVGADNSWRPMLVALNWLKDPTDGFLYQNVFFIQNAKFQYPPTSLLPLALLEKLGIRLSIGVLNQIGWVWIVVTAAAMLVYSLILAERSGVVMRDDRRGRALVAAVAVFATLSFYPVMLAYTIGQVQAWINATFIFACLCWLLERRMATGMLIGAICLLKPQFSLFLIWGALRRQWPFLIGWGLVVAPALILSLVLYGFANHLDYLRVLQFLSHHGEIYYHNQSVGGLLNRLLVDGDSVGLPFGFPPYNPVVYVGMLASSAILVLGALFLRARTPDSGGLLDFLTAALTFTLASPIAWEYHYGVQLPILATLLFALLAQPQEGGRSGLWATLAIVYVLSANYFFVTNETADTPFNFVQSYLLFAGFAALWLLYQVRTPPSFDHRIDRPRHVGSDVATDVHT